MSTNKVIPIRLVLSGGGTRGIAHLGVITALMELGCEVNAYSGASSGALVSTFLCSGHHPEEVLSIILAQKPFNLASGAFSGGLLSTSALAKFLSVMLPSDFNTLKLPLAIVATDLITGKWITFSSGKLIPVLVGSCAVPGLFKPISFENYLLADGGLMNNLPVEVVPPALGKVIAVHVNPVSTIPIPTTAFKILERSFHLGVYSNAIPRMSMANCLIEPPGLSAYRVFDFNSIKETYQIGYDFVIENQVRILREISQ